VPDTSVTSTVGIILNALFTRETSHGPLVGHSRCNSARSVPATSESLNESDIAVEQQRLAPAMAWPVVAKAYLVLVQQVLADSRALV
jgi:hypothetical protein